MKTKGKTILVVGHPSEEDSSEIEGFRARGYEIESVQSIQDLADRLAAGSFLILAERDPGTADLRSALTAAMRGDEKCTSHETTLADLRECEARYRATFQMSPDAVNFNELDGRYVDINEGFTQLTGYDREDVLGRRSSEIGIWAVPEDRDMLYKTVLEKGIYQNLETTFRCKDGSVKTGLTSSRLVSFNGKSLIFSITRDISERKKNEQKNRELLEEKELLLREVHHRVKNNMASIASLLSLKAGAAKSEETRSALREMGSRIRSIQVVYEKLFQSKDYTSISFGDYLHDMLEIIRSSLPADSGVSLDSRLADIPLETNRIFPLGLIANELVTNAIKHAFPDDRNGIVQVILEQTDPGFCELMVSDDGCGLPENLDPKNSTGFGLTLVTALTAQIGGRISFGRGNGTEIRVVFPIPPPTRKTP